MQTSTDVYLLTTLPRVLTCIDDFALCLEEASCGIPPNLPNTQPVPQIQLLYQDTYNYSCSMGYETNDDIITECLANGSLSSDNLANCESKLKLTSIFTLHLLLASDYGH